MQLSPAMIERIVCIGVLVPLEIFHQVHAVYLKHFSDSELSECLHHSKDSPDEAEAPNQLEECADRLDSQLSELACVDKTSFIVENADGENSPQSADSMNRGHLSRVVNLQSIEEVYS